jgi:hypothetical protein
MLKKAVLAACLTFMTLPAEARVFELRTYVAKPGKLDNVVARFRNHTVKLFEKHGMENIGYWVAKDKPDTLIYVVSHKDRAAATASWDAFRKDPDWIKAKGESEAAGPIVDKVESVYMDAVDFSKIR